MSINRIKQAVLTALVLGLSTNAAAQTVAAVPVLKHLAAERSVGATQAMMLGAALAGKRIVAVGDHGIVLLSDDAGKSYRQAQSVPVRVVLTGVSFADAKRGWAVGHWGTVIHTEDGGETWKLQRSDTAIDQPLFSVYFKNSDEGWAVGLWSLLLATRDGGKTWIAQQLPPPPGRTKADRNLYRIFANAAGKLFVAAEQGTVLRSDDNGASWINLGTGYKGTFWTGIALADGSIVVGGLRGTIYRSSDEGQSWQEAQSGMKNSITDFAESDGKLLAVGLDGTFLESTDRGASFKSSQRDDRLPLTAILAVAGGKPALFSKRGPVH